MLLCCRSKKFFEVRILSVPPVVACEAPLLEKLAGPMVRVRPEASALIVPLFTSVMAPPYWKLGPIWAEPPKPATVLIDAAAAMVNVPAVPFISTARVPTLAPSNRMLPLSVAPGAKPSELELPVMCTF